MAAGFTLPAILVITGALLILAVGILLATGIERSTARSFVDRQRAELAARAGLEDIRGIFNLETANDDFIVLQSTLATPITDGRDSAPQLFLARGKMDENDKTRYSFRYVPLFSTLTQPASNSTLAPPPVEPLVGANDKEWFDFATLPYQDKVRAAWLPVQDGKGRTVARYAYWIEDLQGKIDPALVGNEDGKNGQHARAAWPFPAPGLNPDPPSSEESALNQVALFAIDPGASEDQQGVIGKTLLRNRPLLVSPDSLLAAAGIPAPITRDAAGHHVDPTARAVEENLAVGIHSYLEQPLVPYAEGIDPSAAGKPKLNLNQLLAKGGDEAVNEMSGFIRKALPKFEERKGGFPDDYLKTLAANALDYADADGDSSVSANSYRGLDAYPLVSEFLMRFRWENVITEGGRKFMVLSASTYVELWNMSDKDVSGDAQISFETAYNFPLGANPSVSLADLTNASPILAESDGYRWFPSMNVSLKPDEYRVIHCGTVTYKIDAGSSSVFIPSPLVLEGETFGASKAGYRLKWNGKIVDQSRGGLHRNNSSLNYPVDTASQPRQRVRATVPSHSHTRGGTFRNNMGDPRMSCYNLAPQDANVYPDNYSPNRRNIRWGSIYKGDGPTKTKIYGRVMPSEWPDGGHNSTYESAEFHTTDQRINPDDDRFSPSDSSTLRSPPIEEAPMRLSNLGRFYSATELGRIYDPIMWENAQPAGANLPWGDVKTTSKSSTDFGGGNTLRIGRPEHPRFDAPLSPGMEAYHLLDLFHAGISRSGDSAEREGLWTRIAGHVNLNTANRDTLRAIATGSLTMDPKMALRTSDSHDVTGLMAPPVSPFKLTPAEINIEANRIADAIILARKTKPFTSASAIAEAVDPNGKLVFGNKDLLPNGAEVHLTDSAAEEIFARVHEASTVRSRNFRIWVVGQAVSPNNSATAKPEVLSEVRRAYTIFADPGERKTDGSIDPKKSKLTILHENDF